MSIRFAFYGRVSTEDQQDPAASRNWQLSRARALIDTHGEVVTEFFDIGQSRSIPWKRRPQASALLSSLRNGRRGFDAVVIGEPQRAFYGNQYGLTFPLLQHYGVALWVPEVGGPIDPESEAHDLVMSVFGGMSKGERNRIKIRVRSAMSSQAQIEGRFLGGRPPYGYELVDAGPHSNPAKAADGKRLRRLEPEPVAARVVQWIFREYIAGRGLFSIAEELTREGVPSPAANDRGRNTHRSGVAWAKSAVRAILTNPRYTGVQVWNKQRKDEVLIDVEDVALGHLTKMRWNDRSKWVSSNTMAHEAIVDGDTFEQAQAIMAGRGRTRDSRDRQRVRRPYVLRQLIRCAVCERRMQGQWTRGEAYYRCRFPSEYALANKVEHPRNVYVAERVVLPKLDDWLAGLFAPDSLPGTLEAMFESQRDDQLDPFVAQAHQVVVECDTKLSRYRAALEAGTDPQLVATWIAEAQARRAEALARTRQRANGRRMSRSEIGAMVEALGSIHSVLAEADPADKAQVYRQLGLRLTYDPARQSVRTEVDLTAPAVGLWNVSEDRVEP